MNTLDALFSWFSFATVRGALLALGVLALQVALRGRLPARWRYALWLPVVLVLAAPWLPQSRWSLENRFTPTVTQLEPATPAAAVEGELLVQESPAASPNSQPPLQTDWRQIVKVGWLAGGLGVLVLTLAAYIHSMRRMRRGEVPADATLIEMISEAAEVSGLRKAPRVLVSTAVESPAVTGFWRPLLLLPASFPGAFTRAEARLVLLHELTHLKRHDLPLNWLLCLLQALHWCNPVLWFVFARMRADREAACDARVLTLTGTDNRAAYGHALLKLEGSLFHPGFSLGFVGIFESTSGLRARIRAIATHRRAHPAWSLLGAGLIAALTLAGATRAQDPTSGKAAPAPRTAAEEPESRTRKIQQKLNAIVIPRLEFHEATFEEALAFLRAKSVELDTTEPDVAKRGVTILLSLDAPLSPEAQPFAAADLASSRLTVHLSNIPLLEALKYVTALANMKFWLEAEAVRVVPLKALPPMFRREWKITPATPDFGDDVQKALTAAGISFPHGAAAGRSEDGRRLIMLNTTDNLALTDTLLAEAAEPTSRRPAEPAEVDPRKAITRKLNTIIIPRLELRDATLREAVDFLKTKSVELDTAEPDPSKRGVNMVLQRGLGSVAAIGVPGLEPIPAMELRPRSEPAPRITVSLTNVPLVEALRYVTGLAKMKLKIEPSNVSIVPLDDGAGALITKEYRLDVRSINALGLAQNADPKAALAEKRVSFPAGAAATWNPDLRRLIIRNTPTNLEAIESLLDAGR